MRKYLWIILAALFVSVGTSNANADSYTDTFRCTGTCDSIPIAISNLGGFPSPTIDVLWEGFEFDLTFNNPGEAAGDTYVWDGFLDDFQPLPGNPTYPVNLIFVITDTSTGDSARGMVSTAFEGAVVPEVVDAGTLVITPTPEPGSASLMLVGLGLIGLLLGVLNSVVPMRNLKMRKYLWIITLLLLAPCARADAYLATSGFYQPIGDPGSYSIFLSGDGFTATGFIVAGPMCAPTIFRPGQAITGCHSDWVRGFITIIHNGVEEGVAYGSDLMSFFSQADMFLSGATQATLSEPARFGLPAGCSQGLFPDCTFTYLVVPVDGTLTMSLTQDTSSGDYEITSEVYTFSTPESGTLGLVLLGIGSVLVMRRRIARGLPQVT
jgi:hypothetical protein